MTHPHLNGHCQHSTPWILRRWLASNRHNPNGLLYQNHIYPSTILRISQDLGSVDWTAIPETYLSLAVISLWKIILHVNDYGKWAYQRYNLAILHYITVCPSRFLNMGKCFSPYLLDTLMQFAKTLDCLDDHVSELSLNQQQSCSRTGSSYSTPSL